MNFATADVRLWRGGRAVDRAGLENRKAERSREFESHPLRFLHSFNLSNSVSRSLPMGVSQNSSEYQPRALGRVLLANGRGPEA
jgi:hypothetical protein